MPIQKDKPEDFFSRLDEFGLFDHIESGLPDEFPIIYEIARVFENEKHPLTERLAPILFRKPDLKEEKKTKEREIIPVITHSDEYEADLIRTVREVVRIYPHQFLLPDEVFYQKLAERSLWIPRANTPRNFRYQSESDNFAPDSRKQKIYILLDTSSSMISHHRIHVAKAIAYFFLRTNKKELGHIFFRTFDIEIGELRQAKDEHSYEELISHIMHIDTLGNGTAMAKALQIATQDIRKNDDLSEAEILIITDGAVHLDKDKIRAFLGDSIKLNTVKIGTEEVQINMLQVRDEIEHSDTDHAKLLQKFQMREREVQSKISTTAGEQSKKLLNVELSSIRHQMEATTEQFAKKIMSGYGHEIDELSKIYLQIPDVEPQDIFCLPQIRVRELEELAEQMAQEISDHAQPEDIKKAALLYNHLMFLVKYNPIDTQRLKEAAEELQKMLEKFLEDEEQEVESHQQYSMNDRKEMLSLLSPMMSRKRLPLKALIRFLYLRARRKFILWRQHRYYSKSGSVSN